MINILFFIGYVYMRKEKNLKQQLAHKGWLVILPIFLCVKIWNYSDKPSSILIILLIIIISIIAFLTILRINQKQSIPQQEKEIKNTTPHSFFYKYEDCTEDWQRYYSFMREKGIIPYETCAYWVLLYEDAIRAIEILRTSGIQLPISGIDIYEEINGELEFIDCPHPNWSNDKESSYTEAQYFLTTCKSNYKEKKLYYMLII